ncbi:hypothetical protein BUALT_Bualt08G0112800 [Buddleja alternifolia]|uniref:Uncharacterized protein n=1 Tax=Buddleja alternifolia TaxID=168488 RepID=A0AAV6XDT7_9LAMI|nr:hypothetical protein BUALT_Bualt08G0112800 [Buddleja alternifolia]
MSETIDHISVRIDNILLDLPSSPYKPSIFRVSDDLRCVNEKFYEPKLLAVGPFHHSKKHLQKMEQHKFRYLKLLLKRRNESSVDKYVMAIRSFEEKARRCYAESIELSPDDFVQMLLLDGCFIIELIRKYRFDELRERDDTIFQYDQILGQLRHDLMLVENQVPFFVLDQLFSMTRTGNPDDQILHLIQIFIDAISPWPDEASKNTGRVSMKNIDHLLGLVYRIWCSSSAKMTASRPVKSEKEKMLAINSTTELQEAGIKFLKYTESNFLDIKFTKGVMKIPGFDVSDATESILRNLIAYEQFFIDNHPKYVTDYAFFLHCLINSSKDVEILRRRGIVTNLLGDDEMVYRMFNRLGRNILMSSDFCYDDVFNKVNGHCCHLRNRWMANLRHYYFSSPWAYISFFAALMLLLFTLIQTVFSVLSYTKS